MIIIIIIINEKSMFMVHQNVKHHRTIQRTNLPVSMYIHTDEILFLTCKQIGDNMVMK